MLKPFRTYHTLTRVIALVIFLAAALPFIGHVCMMAEAHAMPTLKECCCDRDKGIHEGMVVEGVMEERACDEDKAHHETHEDIRRHDAGHHDTGHHDTGHHDTGHHDPLNHANLQQDCCAVDVKATSFDATPRTNKASAEELVSLALVRLPLHTFLETTLPDTAGGVQDTGPPRSLSLPLHLLFARFLN